MKKSTILLLFTLTTAGFANAEDVTTSGNGVTYTLESLSTTENSGVTKNGKVYTLTNSITIAEGDRFEIESGDNEDGRRRATAHRRHSKFCRHRPSAGDAR